MAINAKNESKPRELTPAGNYVARCYQMVELGTAKEEYKGDIKNLTKVRIGWELPTELKVFKEENGEQPVVISKEYTLSMYEKATLRKDLEAWRGKAFTKEQAECFDVTNLIGAVCMINIIHKPSEKDPSKVYERISSITPIPKGLNCPPQINPTFILSFDEWSDEKFKSLPDFIRERIMKSDEYKAMVNGSDVVDAPPAETTMNQDSNTDDLPF